MRGVRRALRVSPRRWPLLLEAAFELTRASLELKLLPPGQTARLLGRASQGPSGTEEGGDALAAAALVGREVAAAARHLPWRPTCLRQAIAAQRMLRRRSVAGRIHLGVRDPRSLEAHAWVTVGDRVIVGGRGLDGFTELGAFS